MKNTAKKGLMVLVLAAIVAGGAFAQVEGFAVGARAIGVLPFYEASSSLKNAVALGSLDLKGSFGFGAAAQASFNFTELLGVQAEVIFNYDSIDLSGSYIGQSVDLGTIKSTSLLIPLLVRAGIDLDPIQLTAVAGPYYTLALGDMEISSPGYGSDKGKWEGSFGVMGGAIVGYQIGPGAIFADIRYAYDFSDTKDDEDGIYHKSAVHFGLGYSIQVENW